MEWLRNLSLRKAYLLFTVSCFLVAFLLTWGTTKVCVSLRESLAPSGVEIVYDESGKGTIVSREIPTEEAWNAARGVESLQYILTVVYFGGAFLLSGTLFYRLKLKHPIQKLQAGAQRIMEQDLDFVLEAEGKDELESLCAAFEKMRGQLQRSHQELWRQGEERRRLNAAFSHDLRNPVTVLKGSIRVMEKVLQGDRLERAALEDHLARMSHYTERIASYIETMSQVQNLEDTPLSPVEITFGELGKEMQEEGELLLWETACPLSFQFFGSEHAVVWVDRAVVSTILENCLTNASRYAKQTIQVTVSVQGERLTLSVQEDGPGFSPNMLRNGTEPFVRGEKTASEHFGMGLYVCRLLSEKHGGGIALENTETGGRVSVWMKSGKP